MSEDKISFGNSLTYMWKHIIIDPIAGYPILLNDKEVGGILFRRGLWREGVRVLMLEGIEIIPEYRGRGIGSFIIKACKDKCDLLLGSITEDEAKPFWKKVGAEFRPLPLDCFPEHMLPTIHTKEPVFFFMTNHPKGKEFAEFFATEVPKLMKDLPAPPSHV